MPGGCFFSPASPRGGLLRQPVFDQLVGDLRPTSTGGHGNPLDRTPLLLGPTDTSGGKVDAHPFDRLAGTGGPERDFLLERRGFHFQVFAVRILHAAVEVWHQQDADHPGSGVVLQVRVIARHRNGREGRHVYDLPAPALHSDIDRPRRPDPVAGVDDGHEVADPRLV